jgi:hypothetical protein
MFNLSKIAIDYEKESLTATYDLILQDANFPLPIDLESSIIFQKYFIATTGPTIIYSNITFTLGNKVWIQRLQNPYKHGSCSKMIIEKLNMDDILNAIFKCKSRVSGYISRFYSDRMSKTTMNKISKIRIVQVPVKIPTYWIITRKDKVFHKNKKSIDDFLKECNEEPPLMSYMFVFGIFTVAVTFLNLVIQCYL